MLKLACRLVAGSAAAVSILLVGGAALAVPQFTPSGTALLHTLQSGQPGAAYNSGGLGTNGQIDYTDLGSGNGTLNIGAEIDVLNYYDPLDAACPTNVGSNCSYNFGVTGQNLDFMVNADLAGLSAVDIGGGIFQINIQFESTGLGNDFVWTDPLDGDSNMLTASWTAGLFNGVPTTGLEAQVFFDTVNQVQLGNVQVVGFATIQSGLYDSLFGADRVAVDLSSFFDFSPSFAAITNQVISTGQVPSFTAEIQGEIFRVGSGEFIPEPGTALLVGVGLVALGRRRARRS
jgi:hypothetical protein